MDRAEATGLGVALAGHGALLAVLSLGFAASVKPPVVSEPMEVAFVEDVAPTSTAPSPVQTEPAPRLAEVEGPVELAPPEPIPTPMPEPLPVPRVASPPKPTPAPVPKPVERAAAAKPAPAPRPVQRAAAAKPAPAKPVAAAPAPAKPAARPTGRLAGLLNGVGERDSDSRSEAKPAAAVGPAVQASLAGEVRRQLKPHWKAPTGADAELLRTQVTVTLAPDGSIRSIGDVETTGQTASNKGQVKLHQEQAIRAVRLAAPFRLPSEYYGAWKVITPTFDRRLSQ